MKVGDLYVSGSGVGVVKVGWDVGGVEGLGGMRAMGGGQG